MAKKPVIEETAEGPVIRRPTVVTKFMEAFQRSKGFEAKEGEIVSRGGGRGKKQQAPDLREKPHLIAEHDRYLTVLRPFPSLGLCWIFNSNGFQLGSLTGLLGFYRSFKSTFGFEIGRWFVTPPYYGAMFLGDSEHKTSDACHSVVGWDYGNSVVYQPIGSVEEMQNTAYDVMCGLAELVKKIRAGEGVTLMENGMPNVYMEPVFYQMDSLVGSASEDTKETVTKAHGRVPRSFPVEAGKWSLWTKTELSKLHYLPMCIVYTNHQKFKIEQAPMPGRPPEKTSAGGLSPLYLSHYIFELSRMKPIRSTAKDPTKRREGYEVKILAQKTQGPDGRRISAEMTWLDLPTADGSYRQQSFWDWYDCTAKFLNSEEINYRIKDIVAFTEESNRYTCKDRGLVKVTGHEFGKMVESDPALCDAIMARLAIPRRLMLSPEGFVESSDFDRIQKLKPTCAAFLDENSETEFNPEQARKDAEQEAKVDPLAGLDELPEGGDA